MNITIRQLSPKDDRAGFQSGNIELDRFFLRYAGQNQFRHHIGTTYVAVDDNETILGYATVAASEVTATRLSTAAHRRLPAYPLPALRLARLAVDQRAQGRGIAKALLRAVFALAHRMATDMGCVGVLVDAKPEAIGFYRTFGFIELETVAGQLGDRPEPLPMFVELGAIAKPTA